MTGGPGQPGPHGADAAPGEDSSETRGQQTRGSLQPGTRVDHYVLERELGRGGMGQVFLARDTKLDRQVAIKFIAIRSPVAVTRFIAEARVTARCTHPNIVVIHEISEHGGAPYTVLEYVTGESVAALLKAGPIAPARVTAIMTQAARGIAAAHARDIIHRDLKPGNILIAADGAVKVVDFGIAKHATQLEPAPGDGAAAGDATGERELTATDELIGTLHYLAPEQARREPIDARVDLWAFGITMFKMLSGRRPLDGLDRALLLERLCDLDEPMPRLDAIAPATPPALVEIVRRCLEKRVDRRMASAVELVAALEAVPAAAAAAPEAVPAAAAPEAPAPEPARTIGDDRDTTPAAGASDAAAAGAALRDGEPSQGAGRDAATTAAPPRAALGRTRRRAIATAIVVAVAVAAGVWIGRRGRGGDDARHGPATPAAAARVAGLFAEVDRLEGRGQTADAARLQAAFLDEERDPEALALAWLGQADRARDRGERDAAQDRYARAYARATDPAVQRRALLALGTIYRERWEWNRLAAVIDVHDRLPGPRDPRAEDLREQLGLATRAAGATRAGSAATAAIARALLVGRRADTAAASVIAVDHDGDGRAELIAIEAGELVIRGAADGRPRARLPVPGLAALRCAGRDAGGAWVVASPPGNRGDGWQLLRLDGGAAPVALAPLSGPTRDRCHGADLDGDRRDELYLVGPARLVRLTADAAGAWHGRTFLLGSEIGDLVAGDLDGDGRAELVMAVGEWRAYDVRVVRAAPDGGLRIDARLRLGVVSSLAALGRDRDGRALVAAIKEDVYPTIRYLPPDRPAGATAGLYVLALDPRAGLEVVRRVELAAPRGVGPALRGLHAADLDGDGHRDLIATSCPTPTCDLVVMLGRADGGFDVRALGGMAALAVIDADGDAGDEVVARIDGAAAPWLLGAGAEAVPAVAIARVPDLPPSPAARADDAIAGAWRRAEELARIGQVETAVDALGRLAAVGPDPTVKTDSLRRAAALLHAHGLPAASTYEALAALEPVGSRARLDAELAALDEHEGRVEVDAALRVRDQAAAAPALTTAERARLEALRAQLQASPVALFAGDALAAPWRILDPALVHVVPGSRRLTVETLVPGVVAAVPLVRTGELVTLTLDGEIVRTEWAGALRLRLGPRDRRLPGAVIVEIGGRGGGGFYHRRRQCGAPGARVWERSTPLPDADVAEVVHVELALRPTRGRARCAFTTGDRTDAEPLAMPVSTTTDWELSLEGGPDAAMTSAVARFASIVVAGVALAPTSADAVDPAALALTNHRPDEARALLARLPRATATTWPARRLAVIAADELGDRAAAAAALAAAVTAAPARRAPLDDIARLVRARDGQFTPVVRAALAAQVAPVLHAAWTTVATHDLDEPRVRTALIRDLDALPPPSPATAAATLSLDGYLGEARLAAGRPDGGRRALTDGLALLPHDADAATRDRAERIAHLLAVEAATRHDHATAVAWGLRALEVSNYPESAADLLLMDPATSALAADPAWAPIVALGRRLAAAP